MDFVNERGMYETEDRYAIIFKNAFKSLTPTEQKVVMETKVEGDTRTYPEYLKIVAKLASRVFDEDEELGILVYKKMLPNIVLENKEDIEKFDEEMKNRTK